MSAREVEFDGGCSCGHVRFRMSSPPMCVHCCHCHSCQRETGSAFALNALVEADRVHRLAGQVEVVLTPTRSGLGQKIARCPECRVAVWSHYAYAGIGDAVRFVRVGTLDEADRLPPDVHIYTASKQPWVVLPDDVPSFDEYYKASEVWSKAALERRAALFEKASAGGGR